MGGLAEFGRFSEPAMLVLVSLLDEDKHGYAISADIAALTGRQLGPGTLYGAISRLEEAGLITPLAGDGRRKPYALTDEGARVARAEVARLTAVANEAARRLRTREAPA
jgi:DNA-binding PadR family transcriptional regulator